MVEQSFFDRDQQMVGQQTKEDMRIGAPLFVVEDWPDDERRFHVAEGILGAGEQGVDAPDLIGGEVFAIGLTLTSIVVFFCAGLSGEGSRDRKNFARPGNPHLLAEPA